MQTNLPPELEELANPVDDQPDNVREFFLYAMAMLLVEDSKAKVLEQETIDYREYLTRTSRNQRGKAA